MEPYYRMRKQSMEYFLKRFFVWFVQLKKNMINLEFHALLFKHFFIKIPPNMSEQEKTHKEFMICLTPKELSEIISFFMASIKPRPYPLDYAIWDVLDKCNFPSKYYFA